MKTLLLTTRSDARALLASAWPAIIGECRSVLAGERHDQAISYHCLNRTGFAGGFDC